MDMIELCVSIDMLNFLIPSHKESALYFILSIRKQKRFLFFYIYMSVFYVYSLSCFAVHVRFPFPFLSFVSLCLSRSFTVAHLRWNSLYLFFKPQSASSCIKVHQRAPPLFPSAIKYTRPLKHIKSPAGDRETVSRYLHFLCFHHQPLWHAICLWGKV